MKIQVAGTPPLGITPKDLILNIIKRIGSNGALGHVIEFTGQAIERMSMEGRMTLCNMAVEAGARAGLIAPDEKTYLYLKGRPQAPSSEHWDRATEYWAKFFTDQGAEFDSVFVIDATDIEPMVTWGTSPEDVVAVGGKVPSPECAESDVQRLSISDSLDYMGLRPGQNVSDITVNRVFIGSCTNGRIEDLRAAAHIVKGHKVAVGVSAMIVPGSGLVKRQAEQEGLDVVFKAAGFDWREAGCSMCLGMNADRLRPGERCASTSNRNFKGRQGPGGRTHLVSPAMAAAAAIAGRFVDIRQWVN